MSPLALAWLFLVCLGLFLLLTWVEDGIEWLIKRAVGLFYRVRDRA